MNKNIVKPLFYILLMIAFTLCAWWVEGGSFSSTLCGIYAVGSGVFLAWLFSSNSHKSS